MLTAIINWLNDEDEAIILQRENTFAMLTWRDFNPPAQAPFHPHTAAWLFILAAGIPILVLS